MEIIGTASKVTIYIGESDRHGNKPLYMAILELLKAEDCAGATVVRGLAGFGAHSRIHTFKIERLSQDLPVIVEIVDTREELQRYLSAIDPEIHEGLATMEEISVHSYRSRKS